MGNHKLLFWGVVTYSLQMLLFTQTAGTTDLLPYHDHREARVVVTPPLGFEEALDARSIGFTMPVAPQFGLQKSRDLDFVGFVLAARFAHVAQAQINGLSKTLVNAAYAKFSDEDVAHRYLIALAPLIAVEQKQKAYSLSLFDTSAASDLNKLCGPYVSQANLKDTKTQLRASACYFEALSASAGSYYEAAQQMDRGQQIARLLRAKKPAAQMDAESGTTTSELDGIMPSAVPSDELVAVEKFFGRTGDTRYASLFNYGLVKISSVDAAVSPMRQAVLSHSLTQTALAVLQTDDEAQSFMDLIGSVSKFQPSAAGLGGLTVVLGEFAAEECGLSHAVREQDLDADQSGLLLSACLFRGTLRRFGGDTDMAAVAYKALVARGQTTAELFGRSLAQNYTLSAWTEVMRPVPMQAAADRPAALVKALAKIVHSPLQDTLRGDATFTVLAKVAQAIFPGDDEGQKNWLIVLAMESKFDGGPTSETGARGIGQLIPTYAHDFGEGCNLTHVDKVDLADDTINALLSACYLKTLVDTHDGMVMLALAAYNAGLNSEDLSHFRHLSRMSNEPANYVARFALIKESLERVLPREKPGMIIAATAAALRIPMAGLGEESSASTH